MQQALTTEQKLDQLMQMMGNLQQENAALRNRLVAYEQSKPVQNAQPSEDLEKPPQIAQETKKPEQKQAEDVVYNDWNRSLSSMSAEQTQKAIHEKALKDGASYGPEVIQAMEAKMLAGLKSYQEIKPYDPVVGGFIQNNVSTAAAIGEKGYAGQATTVQQQIPVLPDGAGVLYGNATLHQDRDLNVTGGNVGLNYASPVITKAGVDAVGIANVNVTIPEDGNVEAKDVGYLAGAVLKGHEGKDNVNHTVAYIGNGAGDSHTLLYRPSKEIYNDGDNKITGYAPITYGVNKVTDVDGRSKWEDAFGAKAGLRADRDLGDGTSLYAQAEGGVDDAFGKASPGGMVKFGFAWGGAEKKSSTPEQTHAEFAPETHQHASAVQSQAIAQPASHATATRHENQNYQSITHFSNDEKMHKMQLAYNSADEHGRHQLLNVWASKLAHNMHMGKHDAEETVRDFLNIPSVQVVAERGHELSHG